MDLDRLEETPSRDFRVNPTWKPLGSPDAPDMGAAPPGRRSQSERKAREERRGRKRARVVRVWHWPQVGRHAGYRRRARQWLRQNDWARGRRGPPPRPHNRNSHLRTRRECRPRLAGQPPVVRRQLEPAKLLAAMQRQNLHRHGHGFRRRRRNGHGPPSLPCRRPDAQVQGPLQGPCPPGHPVAHQSSAGRRQPGQGRGADDVFARIGHDRPVRGLRAERRQASRHGGAGGGEFHPCRPEHGRRRLAVQSQRPRRHLRGRLAVDGPEERQHGRPERRRVGLFRHQQVARFGRRTRWHASMPISPASLLPTR